MIEQKLLGITKPQITTDALLIQQAWDAETGGRVLGISFPRHVEYCAMWHFDYRVQMGPIRHYEKTDPWQKLAMVQEAFYMHYKYVVWLDADTLIMDMAQDLREACVGPCSMVRWPKPMEHFQAGVMFFKNEGVDAFTLVTHCLEEKKYYLSRFPTKRGWHEQGQLNEIYETSPELFYSLPLEYNWSAGLGIPCEHPIIKAWHGESLGACAEGMIADVVRLTQEENEAYQKAQSPTDPAEDWGVAIG